MLEGVAVSKEEIQRVLYGNPSPMDTKRVKSFIQRNLKNSPEDNTLLKIKEMMNNLGLWKNKLGRKSRKEELIKSIQTLLIIENS